jgi:hypothetical protein
VAVISAEVESDKPPDAPAGSTLNGTHANTVMKNEKVSTLSNSIGIGLHFSGQKKFPLLSFGERDRYHC